MVALALGATVVAAIGNALASATHGQRQARASAQVQDHLRFAMARIARDVEMAGFFADVHDAEFGLQVSTAARRGYSGSCPGTWLFDDRLPIDVLDNADASAVRKRFPCVEGPRSGSDVLAIKRVAGNCTGQLESNRYYLLTGARGFALQLGDPGGTGELCEPARHGGWEAAYRYRPSIWHIGTDAGQPSLCREVLAGTRMTRECLVQGIEDLQLEFGIDSSNDGIAERFESLDGPVDQETRRNIVAVRIHLLARSLDPARCEAREFRLGNAVHKPQDDGWCRDSLGSTVVLRNAARAAGNRALPG